MLPQYYVVLQNDDINSFENVVKVLNEKVGLTEEQGMLAATIVNTKGECPIATAHFELAETICCELIRSGLKAVLKPKG
jgi:ATP-dependent Clp protease adapter protein ClpS